MSKDGYGSAAMSTGTATTNSGTILAANANRKYLMLANTGGTPCYVGLGGAAVINQGIRLNGAGSAGDSHEMSRAKANVYSGAITAILTVAGTAQLSIVEGV